MTAEEESKFQCVQTRWQMKTSETKLQEKLKQNRRNASRLRVALRDVLFFVSVFTQQTLCRT